MLPQEQSSRLSHRISNDASHPEPGAQRISLFLQSMESFTGIPMKARHPHVSTALINVATFDEPDKATAFRQFLREEGIAAQVHDERRLQKNWFLTRSSHAGVHVRVPEHSFEFTQNLLEISPKAQSFLSRAIHCPSCNSARVQFPQMTRKNVLPTLMAQMLVLFGVMQQECYCEACQYTWRPADGRSPSADSSSSRKPLRTTPRLN